MYFILNYFIHLDISELAVNQIESRQYWEGNKLMNLSERKGITCLQKDFTRQYRL